MGAPVEAHDGNVDAVDAHGEAAILRRHPRGAGPGGEWLVSAVSVLQAAAAARARSLPARLSSSSWLGHVRGFTLQNCVVWGR